MPRRIWKSTDVVWATSLLGWFAASGWTADSTVVGWKWYRSRHAQSPTKIDGDCPCCPIPGSSSRREAPVVSESLPETPVRCPTPTVGSCLKRATNFKSRVELARGVARVHGQPAGKEVDSDTSDENVPLLVPKSAQIVPGRQHHRLRNLVDHLMCLDGRSEESLLERKAVKTLAARRN